MKKLLLFLIVTIVQLISVAQSQDSSDTNAFLAANNETTPQTSVSFAFVLDDTGSMKEEIDAAREGIINIMNEASEEISKYIVVAFNDPRVGPALESINATEVKDFINSISVSGGGDCPEMAMSALLKAIELSDRNSFIYYYSDASAKDYYKKTEVENAANAKNIKIYYMLTGCCYSNCDNIPATDQYYYAYADVEKKAKGKIYKILKKNAKSKLKKFMKYLLIAVKKRAVKYLSYPPATFQDIENVADGQQQLFQVRNTDQYFSTANKQQACQSRKNIQTTLQAGGGDPGLEEARSAMETTMKDIGVRFDDMTSLYTKYTTYLKTLTIKVIDAVKYLPFGRTVCTSTENSFLYWLDTNGYNSVYLVYYEKTDDGGVSVTSFKNVTGYLYRCNIFMSKIRTSVLDEACSALNLQSTCLTVLLMVLAVKWIVDN